MFQKLLFNKCGGSDGLAGLQLDCIDDEEGSSTDGAAEDDGQDAEQEAALGQDLPEDEADGTGDDGQNAGILGSLLDHHAQAVSSEGTCAADAEGKGVQSDDGNAQHGDAHSAGCEDHVHDTGGQQDLLVLHVLAEAIAEDQVVHNHGGHAQQVGVSRGHGSADDGSSNDTGNNTGSVGGSDLHHGVGAVGSQVGQGVLHGQGSQAQDGWEQGHGSHQDAGQQRSALCGLLVLGRLETGDHFGAGQEGAEVVEDVADDGDPADLGEAQLHGRQSLGDNLPAADTIDDHGGSNGQANQDDTELDQVADLVSDHAAEGGVQDDDNGCHDQSDVLGHTGQGGDNHAGSSDLGRGQAEQSGNIQNCSEVAGQLAKAAADDLGDGDSHSLADLGCEVRQGDHCDGGRQNVPAGAHAPVAEGLGGQAGGGAAANVIGGQGECDHEQAHAAACDHVVLAVLDLLLGNIEANAHHDCHVANNNKNRCSLHSSSSSYNKIQVNIFRYQQALGCP